VDADAEQGDRRIEQPVRVQREAVFRWRLRERELQVPFQQRPYVMVTRIVDGNPAASNHLPSPKSHSKSH
jgi:hypothetical protein